MLIDIMMTTWCVWACGFFIFFEWFFLCQNLWYMGGKCDNKERDSLWEHLFPRVLEYKRSDSIECDVRMLGCLYYFRWIIEYVEWIIKGIWTHFNGIDSKLCYINPSTLERPFVGSPSSSQARWAFEGSSNVVGFIFIIFIYLLVSRVKNWGSVESTPTRLRAIVYF